MDVDVDNHQDVNFKIKHMYWPPTLKMLNVDHTFYTWSEAKNEHYTGNTVYSTHYLVSQSQIRFNKDSGMKVLNLPPDLMHLLWTAPYNQFEHMYLPIDPVTISFNLDDPYNFKGLPREKLTIWRSPKNDKFNDQKNRLANEVIIKDE